MSAIFSPSTLSTEDWVYLQKVARISLRPRLLIYLTKAKRRSADLTLIYLSLRQSTKTMT